MRGSRKFCQMRFNFDRFFLVNEGRVDPNTTLNVPSSTRLQNALALRFAGVP